MFQQIIRGRKTSYRNDFQIEAAAEASTKDWFTRMEWYVKADGETSEAVTGDEVYTAGDFLIEETAFRDNGIFSKEKCGNP